VPEHALVARTKGTPRMNTTLVVVATDAALTKAQAKHLAAMAHDGLARAIHPVHTALDGDIVFATATGRRPLANPPFDLTAIGSAAAIVVARAIARSIYEAKAISTALPAYRDRFPR
jgi:D-aminopeptidase